MTINDKMLGKIAGLLRGPAGAIGPTGAMGPPGACGAGIGNHGGLVGRATPGVSVIGSPNHGQSGTSFVTSETILLCTVAPQGVNSAGSFASTDVLPIGLVQALRVVFPSLVFSGGDGIIEFSRVVSSPSMIDWSHMGNYGLLLMMKDQAGVEHETHYFPVVTLAQRGFATKAANIVVEESLAFRFPHGSHYQVTHNMAAGQFEPGSPGHSQGSFYKDVP